MISSLTKQFRTSNLIQFSQLRTLSTQAVTLEKLNLKKKFHGNKNVPDLFKNSKTDDYVSLKLIYINYLL
jgi:hypothetical protein